MPYTDYLLEVSRRFDAKFSEIAAEHNFELGDEFEIAVCQVLRLVLPNRFGICRGFIVSGNGSKAGDDLIIFDRERFPTLRLLPQNDFSRLENVPAEAVCAYLEAKHSIYIPAEDETGESLSETNLDKALRQVIAAKRTIRAKTPLGMDGIFQRAKDLGDGIKVPEHDPLQPDHRNPIYGGIIARHVYFRDSDRVVPTVEQFGSYLGKAFDAVSDRPDVIIAGRDIVTLPVFPPDEDSKDRRVSLLGPFHLHGKSHTAVHLVEGAAWGVGVALILQALQLMKLSDVDWFESVVELANRERSRGGSIGY